MKWTLISLGVLVVLIGGTGYALIRTFYPSPPAADFPPTTDVATAQRQDFEYFRHYFELNRTYTPAARARAEQLLAEYEAQAGKLTAAQFHLAIARIAALGDNGHSRIIPSSLSRAHNRLPCRLYRFADGYHVIRARPACAGLLGARVIALGGRPTAAVADAMYPYFSGPRNHFDQFASPFFLESPELLHAAGLIPDPGSLMLQVQLRDGSTRELEMAADPANPDGPRLFGSEFLSPQPLEDEEPDWQALLPADAKLPLFLRDFSVPFHAECWRDRNTCFVQFRSNADEPGHPIGEFVEHVRREIRANRPRVIVVDLRFDQGGNFTTTASLMKELTTLTSTIEQVHVLTSAWTFSAGNVNVALSREHGGAKVSVIGEPVGDRIRLWAEGGILQLPHSGLRIGFATGLHDYSGSCWGEPGCFWVMYFYPMTVASLEPDVPVSYSFTDYVSLRDPVLERALALAEQRRSRS